MSVEGPQEGTFCPLSVDARCEVHCGVWDSEANVCGILGSHQRLGEIANILSILVHERLVQLLQRIN